MTLEQCKDWLKANIDCGQGITCGKLDAQREQGLALYNGREPAAEHRAIGGDSSYRQDRFSLLVHWGKSAARAEEKACAVYNALRRLENGRSFVTVQRAAPIPLGQDARGVFEYAIDFTVTERVK